MVIFAARRAGLGLSSFDVGSRDVGYGFGREGSEEKREIWDLDSNLARWI